MTIFAIFQNFVITMSKKILFWLWTWLSFEKSYMPFSRNEFSWNREDNFKINFKSKGVNFSFRQNFGLMVILIDLESIYKLYS